jgi:hypothetical protein
MIVKQSQKSKQEKKRAKRQSPQVHQPFLFEATHIAMPPPSQASISLSTSKESPPKQRPTQ